MTDQESVIDQVIKKISKLALVREKDIGISKSDKGWFADVYINGKMFRSNYTTTPVAAVQELFSCIQESLHNGNNSHFSF